MNSALRSDVAILNKLNDSIIGNCGKMLRPMIVLLFNRLLRGGGPACTGYAAAVELLHNATLIHDDVADRSKTRRGSPSVASVIGPAGAVLVGDFWLARSVDLVYDPDADARIPALFSKTLSDLAEGEMLQMEKAGSADTSEEDYYRIIYCKTASLFETAGRVGAIAAEASDVQVEAAAGYSKALGLAFQIKDDILDYAGDARLGKPLGTDLSEQKITLPLLGAFRNSPAEESVIRKMVRDIHSDSSFLPYVDRFVRAHDGIRYAARILDGFVADAVKALDAFEDCRAKEFLRSIAEYNVFRAV